MTGFKPFSLFKRSKDIIPVLDSDLSISVGDRFQQINEVPSVWVVERISRVSSSNLPLISLSREGRPDLKKVLSISILQDTGNYRPTLQ